MEIWLRAHSNWRPRQLQCDSWLAPSYPHLTASLHCQNRCLDYFPLRDDSQRAAAAALAISLRFDFERLFARAFPPKLPSWAAALWALDVSVSSPVAIRITLTALPITSAGRFWPFGPVGIDFAFYCGLYLLLFPRITTAI